MCYTRTDKQFEEEARRIRADESRRQREERSRRDEEKWEKPLTEKVREMVGAK